MIDPILSQYVQEFLDSVTSQTKDIYKSILQNTLIPYIIKTHSEVDTIDNLFGNEFTRIDIINAGVEYVDTTRKVRGVKAVERYLSAIGEFYRSQIEKRYPINPLQKISNNFQSLKDEIIYKSSKELHDEKSYHEITDDEYIFIVSYLQNDLKKSYKNNLISIMIKLILLYGFKIGTISLLRFDNYSCEERVIILTANESNKMRLEIPYGIAKQLNDYIINNKHEGGLLFHKEKVETPIESGYFAQVFDALDDAIEDPNHIHFTLSGLSKYAVIRMFLKGMNPITIGSITGMQLVDLLYCQKRAEEILSQNELNSMHINSIMRSVAAYEDFTKL